MLATAPSASAGMMEISTSYSIRDSSIDDYNYTKNEAWTGSFAWYFLELSAIELSYTNGTAEQSLSPDNGTTVDKYYAKFEMYGADLVFTFAGKDSFLQPFIRGGVAYLNKKFYKEDTAGTVTNYGVPIEDTVPSYGAGFKIRITQGFSIKMSYDTWRSGNANDKDIWDEAIKAGVSWMF
jgi:Outer membrane protein beta-barrel domain